MNPRGPTTPFKNQGEQEIDLTGWRVSDEANHQYLVPHFILHPGARVMLRTGTGKNSADELYWGSRLTIWNNDHDTVFLRDAEGNLVVAHSY